MTISSITTTISLVHSLDTKAVSYFMEVVTYGHDDNGNFDRKVLVHSQVSRPSMSVLKDCRKQFVALKKRGAQFSYELCDDYAWAQVRLNEKTGEE